MKEVLFLLVETEIEKIFQKIKGKISNSKGSPDEKAKDLVYELKDFLVFVEGYKKLVIEFEEFCKSLGFEKDKTTFIELKESINKKYFVSFKTLKLKLQHSKTRLTEITPAIFKNWDFAELKEQKLNQIIDTLKNIIEEIKEWEEYIK